MQREQRGHGDPLATLCPHAGLPCAHGHAHVVSPAPVSPAPPPALTSQRCLELVPGAALDPSSGLSSTAPRAARGGAELSGSGWQLAGTEPAGGDKETVARPRCLVPPLPQGTHGTATLGRGAQGWRQAGDLRHVPERGRDSGCSDSSSWGAAWPPPSWLCSCARSCSEKERSRFSDTSAIGESSSCKAMDTALPSGPPHTLRTSRVPLTSTLPLFSVPSLASETFISSISARVGALSRTRGRGRAGTVLTGVRESSRQELEARRPEQAWGMQGREL